MNNVRMMYIQSCCSDSQKNRMKEHCYDRRNNGTKSIK